MIRFLLPLFAMVHGSTNLYSYTGVASNQSYSYSMIDKARKRNQRNKSQKRR